MANVIFYCYPSVVKIIQSSLVISFIIIVQTLLFKGHLAPTKLKLTIKPRFGRKIVGVQPTSCLLNF